MVSAKSVALSARSWEIAVASNAELHAAPLGRNYSRERE
jgi:hypothetical protein